MPLRWASGVRWVASGRWIFRHQRLEGVGRDPLRIGRKAFNRLEATVSADGAAQILEDDGRALWWTGDGFYWDDERLGAEAVSLLAWDRRRRLDARVDRLRRVRASEEAAGAARRARIPDDVRLFVWTRDEGRCVRCGAEDDLQFDHLIPVARGGGNAAENLQVLCGPCNRAKSDAIA